MVFVSCLFILCETEREKEYWKEFRSVRAIIENVESDDWTWRSHGKRLAMINIIQWFLLYNDRLCRGTDRVAAICNRGGYTSPLEEWGRWDSSAASSPISSNSIMRGTIQITQVKKNKWTSYANENTFLFPLCGLSLPRSFLYNCLFVFPV